MTTLATAVPRATHRRRYLRVMHVHGANPWTTVYWPVIIFAAVFGMTFTIWRIVESNATGPLPADAFQSNGGASWVLFYLAVAAVQAMNYTFRYALGLSVTRREYFFGTSAYFAAMAFVYGTALTGLAALERATNGWGIGGAFFAPFGLSQTPLWQVWTLWVALLFVFLFVGAASGAVFVRWRAGGLVIMFLGLALLLVGALWVVGQLEAWSAIGRFFTQTPVYQLSAWSLLIACAAAIAGYLVLRRATPRG